MKKRMGLWLALIGLFVASAGAEIGRGQAGGAGGTGCPLGGCTFTGAVLFPDGTVGAPSIGSSTDPTDGFYHLSTGWHLAVDGVLAARWLSSGAVTFYDPGTANITASFGQAGGALKASNLFRISWNGTDLFFYDEVDNTKLISWDMSYISTGTTRDVSFPDQAGTIAVLAADGIAVRTAAGSITSRTVTSSDGSLTVSNGNGVGGNIDAVVDTAVFPRYSSGTGDVPATGAVGTFYAETDANSFYTYPSTDTEHWLLSAAAGTTIGDFFYVSAVDVLTAINGTDGNLITWSADDVPALVTTGASGNVLVSGGAGVAPTFTDMPYTSLADGTDGNLITWGADGAPALVATGTATQVLTSNGADTAPTFQAAAGGAPFDPGTQIQLTEEFVSGTTSSGHVGTLGLSGSAIATGTASIAIVPADTEHPGLYRLLSHVSNDDSGYTVHVTNTGTANNWGTFWHSATASWEYDALVLFGSNSTAITNTALWVGLSNGAADPAAQSAGIWIRHDSDRSDTTFTMVTCDSASSGCGSDGDDTNQKVAASSITPSAGNWYRFRISQDFTGPTSSRKISMRVNDETAVTFCSSGCSDDLTQVPTGVLRPQVTYLTRTTTGVLSADVDYMSVTVSGLSRY